jgi:hypothetical protein
VPTRSRPSAVDVRRPDLAAWRHALELADGDVRRLTVLEDGTVLVSNDPEPRR